MASASVITLKTIDDIRPPRMIDARPDYAKMRPSTGNAARDKLVAAKLQVRATRSE